MKFIFEWNLFLREKINFICSNRRVIFFLLHRYLCLEKQKKNKEMTSAISSLVRIWKICHSYPGCSFIWNLRVAHFTVKHSYLCNIEYYYTVAQKYKLYKFSNGEINNLRALFLTQENKIHIFKPTCNVFLLSGQAIIKT